MTIEQFRAEYHLLDRVSDGTVETHHAQAAAGVMVMVHFLRGTESQNATILERIERLETGRRQKVLRIVDVDGVTAVVTRFILDLTSFEEWLGVEPTPADPAAPDTPRGEGSVVSDASATRHAPPAGGPGGPATESDEATPRRFEPGDFTVAFQALAQPTDPASPVPPPAPDETIEPEPDRPVTSPEQKPSAGPSPSESAEFARLFAGPGRPQPTLRQGAPEQGTAGPRPPAEPAPPAASPPPPATPTRPAPEASPPPTAEPPPAEPTPAASPPPSPPFQPPGRPMPDVGSLRKSEPREPGGYTRLVKPQPIPEPPPRGDGPPTFPDPGADQAAGPPEKGRGLHYGKDSFRERLAAPSPDASPPPPAAPIPPPPVAPAGPGEYTKVIESMPTPNLGPSQRSPSPAPPPPAPKPPAASNKLLVFALFGVLLAAIVFVVIFAILT